MLEYYLPLISYLTFLKPHKKPLTIFIKYGFLVLLLIVEHNNDCIRPFGCSVFLCKVIVLDNAKMFLVIEGRCILKLKCCV